MNVVPKPDHVERLLDVPAVAEILSCSQAQAWSLVASGALPSCKIGRLRRIRETELRAYIEGLTAA